MAENEMPTVAPEPTETLVIPAAGQRPAEPGTIERHYGFDFVVQADGSRVGEVPLYAVADQIAAGRMERPASPAASSGAAGAGLAQSGDAGSGSPSLAALLGVSDETAAHLAAAGFASLAAIAASDPTALTKVHGVGKAKAADMIVKASELLAPHEAGAGA